MAATWLASGGKLGFGVKPQLPVLDMDHPLVAGLVFDANYYGPGGLGNIERTGRTPISTYTTTTATIGPHGVNRRFPGSAATDRDVYVADASVNSLGRVSYEFLFKPNGAGGGNQGRLFLKGPTSAAARLEVLWNDTSSFVRVLSIWSTGNGDWQTANSALLVGAWAHVVITYDYGSTANVPVVYINGAPKTLTVSFTPTGVAPTDSTNLIIGNRDLNDRSLNADVSHMRAWNRLLSIGEVETLYADPFQIYQSGAVSPVELFGSLPTAFSATVAETASATDSPTETTAMAASLSESGTATDTTSGVLTYAVSVSESGTATDSISETTAQAATVSEVGSAADSPTETTAMAAAVTEAGTATDALTPSATMAGTISEAATAADSLTPAATMPVSVSEGASAADTPSATMAAAATVSETGAAADTLTSKTLATIAETASAADALTPSAAMAASVSEVASAADDTEPGVQAIPITETGAAAEVASATMAAAASLGEVASAADALGPAFAPTRAVAETATATDGISATLAAAAAVVEAGSAADAAGSSTAQSGTISEAAAAADVIAGGILFVGAIAEVAAAIDAISAQDVVLIGEAAAAQDSVFGVVTIPGAYLFPYASEAWWEAIHTAPGWLPGGPFIGTERWWDQAHATFPLPPADDLE